MNAAQQFDADVVIVGAGVSGALIAKQLGLAGHTVLILESGAPIPTNINGFMERFYTSSAKVPEAPYTPALIDQDTQQLANPTALNAPRPTVLTLGASNWQDPSQSYLIQKGPLPFSSTYERIAGGTMRHWLGTSLRFVPNDFQMNSAYGQEVDWPISYDDLEKWYGDAEAEIGVSADVFDQQYLGIAFPPGYQYPMRRIPPSLVDEAVTAAAPKVTIDGIALTVTNTPAGRNSEAYQERPACQGNTNCIPICPIRAKYDPSVTLNAALQTGNVTIWAHTVATNVNVDAGGNVSSIDYVQYEQPGGPPTKNGTVTARLFVLAAHAIETPKLLLMSKNDGRTPNGVANMSGQVGKNLMDHPLYLAWALAKEPVYGYRGPLSTGGIEDARDGAFRKNRAAYRIEIGNEGWNFAADDPYTTTVDFVMGRNDGGLNGNNQALFGDELVNTLNSNFTRQFRLGFLVEQSPDQNNYVTLSTTEKDHLGLPRPEIHYDLSDYTKAGFASAYAAAQQIFEAMGATPFTKTPDNDPATFMVTVPGETGPQQVPVKFFGAGHVAGTYRMGSDPSTSVVNSDQRSWDHKNLFLVGSGVFPTIATGNPTLTIAALSLRAAGTILADLKGVASGARE